MLCTKSPFPFPGLLMSVTTQGGLLVKTVWSKAGVGTTVHVQGIGKQANILFDCGHLDEREFAAKHVFISHGHVDHIGSCITHARGKALSGKPATYYVPPHCVEPMHDAQRAFETLDDKNIPMNIVAMKPFDVVEISPKYKVFAFPTEHRVPSQGCTKEEIIELRKQKVCVYSEEHRVELVYSGDSTLQGLLNVPEGIDLDFLLTAEVLLLEMTYLDGEVSKAAARGHVHLQDLLLHGHLFSNRQIILMHISTKYSLGQIKDTVARLPLPLRARTAVALSSFGDTKEIREAESCVEVDI